MKFYSSQVLEGKIKNTEASRVLNTCVSDKSGGLFGCDMINGMKVERKYTYCTCLLSVLFAVFFASQVSVAQGAGSLETSVWIPYWRSKEGVKSALEHLDTLSEINPFFYTVKRDGTLFPNGSFRDSEWATLKVRAKEKGIRFIPTVTWANSDAIDSVLRDPAKRQAHIRSIMGNVYAWGFDGIDIDYEAKHARTRPFFSLFLKELEEAMGFDKWIMCTIEARTPLDSRYESPGDIPSDIEYANDYPEINKYCDRVRIMAYDQGRVDVKLNAANENPYIPVSDRAWVDKVARLALKDIDAGKLAIGIPTYGYEYDMFPPLGGASLSDLPQGKKMRYSRLWSLNPNYALDLAKDIGATPSRSSAGETFFTYPASKSPDGIIPLPFATRVVTWSDAEAIRQKATLAAELGVAGVVVFKVDGGEDSALWAVLAQYKSTGAKAVSRPPVVVPATRATFVVPSDDLEFGARGEDVRFLQKLLNTHGFTVASSGGGSPGNETTYFGPATRDALIHFQKAKNITPAIGYFGPITRAAFELLR